MLSAFTCGSPYSWRYAAPASIGVLTNASHFTDLTRGRLPLTPITSADGARSRASPPQQGGDFCPKRRRRPIPAAVNGIPAPCKQGMSAPTTMDRDDERDAAGRRQPPAHVRKLRAL